MNARPDLYKKEDWTVYGLGIYLATRRGQNIYTARALPYGSGSKVVGNIGGFRRQPTDERGSIIITTLSGVNEPYKTKEAVEAMAEHSRDFGKLYVLQEGSSSKGRGGKRSKVGEFSIQPT